MTLLRTQLGNTLRGHRQSQRRTLRDVSGVARVSLGYLSEVERGQKEASSELLASICEALDLELADLLAEVSLELRGVRVGSAGAGEVRPLGASTENPSTENPSAESQDAGQPTAEQAVPGQPAAEPALALVGAAPGRTGPRRGETVSLAA
jgi:transcriptional regulator with XRE-family HTH domain